MKAMIFAAGLGTRLKPITNTLPKALVPVAGKPLIEHVCRKLMDADINEVVVNIHHFADKVEAWAQEQNWISLDGDKREEGQMYMRFSDERQQLLETGGAVLHAREYLEGCGHFMIHNVDIISNADFNRFTEQLRDDALATLLVSPRKSTRYFLFHPESMRLVGWKNVSTGDSILVDSSMKAEDCRAYAFSGIHILSDKVLDLMEEYVIEKGLERTQNNGTRFPIKDFYLWAAARKPIYGVVAEDLVMVDVGKLDTLSELENRFRKV